MQTRRAVWVAAAMVTLLALITGSCTDESGGVDNQAAADDLNQQFTGSWDNVPAIEDALQRLVVTINGDPQPGVAITPTANGYAGSVSADIDGNDGVLETSVSGTLTFINPALGLAGGANIVIASITGGAPQDASGSAVLTQTGIATVQLSDGAFSTVTQTRDNDLTISGAQLTGDISTGSLVVSGEADFTFNGLAGLLTFEPLAGGFQVNVSGQGFDPFTVP